MHLGTLLTLPLLAAAVPAAPLTGNGNTGQGQAVLSVPEAQTHSYDPDISIDLDLDDLRLVRFAEDESPV